MLKKTIILLLSLIAVFILFNSVIMPLYVKHSDTVKVPKITGLNFLEGKKVVEDAGLEIMQGDVKYDENTPIGLILDQNPPVDEIVKNGRRIYVTISGGEQLAEVPNLKGKSLRDAKFTLEQRGLKLGGTVRKNTTEFPEGYVISQIIQPGSKIKKNSTMDLILSDGPVVGDLKVPSLTGKTLEEAKKIIAESKLKVGKITYQTNNELPPGQIIDQYPKNDKSANENTTVDLFVSRKKAVVKEENEEPAPSETIKPKESEPEKPTDIQKEKPKDESTGTQQDKKTDKKIQPPAIKKDDATKPKQDKVKDGGTDNTNK
jgi:serine/threonine-protein kinase